MADSRLSLPRMIVAPDLSKSYIPPKTHSCRLNLVPIEARSELICGVQRYGLILTPPRPTPTPPTWTFRQFLCFLYLCPLSNEVCVCVCHSAGLLDRCGSRARVEGTVGVPQGDTAQFCARHGLRTRSRRLDLHFGDTWPQDSRLVYVNPALCGDGGGNHLCG